ncbi:MAG: peptidoglycan editing factor PgeF [Clostridia bacterium]|nr:peptidoglycan editing factor PgeF [Clostridia bacterium]
MAELRKNEKDGITYYTAPQLEPYRDLAHGFFTRRGGVSGGVYDSLNFRFSSEDTQSNVLENHRRAGALLGADESKIVRTLQKHTDNILVIRGEYIPYDPSEPVDAIVTDVRGLCLTAYFADCQVVMLYDNKKKVCAIVHAGWRGAVNGIVKKTIQKMTDIFGCKAKDISAAVGPSICRRCFECDEDVPILLSQAYDRHMSEYIYKDGKKWHVDLKNITYVALTSSGISPINIDVSSLCPCCTTSEELWWSHRRHKEQRGVQGAMIMIK